MWEPHCLDSHFNPAQYWGRGTQRRRSRKTHTGTLCVFSCLWCRMNIACSPFTFNTCQVTIKLWLMETACSVSVWAQHGRWNMVRKRCKQTEVGEVEEEILHLSSWCSFVTESSHKNLWRSTRNTFLQSFLGVPALKHQTLCLCRQRE